MPLDQYVRILDHSPDMIAYMDTNRRYVFVNKRYCEVVGMAEHEIVGCCIDDVFDYEVPDLPESIRTRMELALAGEEQQFELKSRIMGGKERWIEASYVPDFGSDNEVLGIFAYVRDIHDRKIIEQSRARFEHAVNQGVEGFALHDEAGNFTYVNPAQAAFYGYRPEEVLGQSWTLFYDDDQIEEIKTVHFPQLMTEGKWRGELIGRKKCGEKFNIEVSLTLLVDDEGNPAGLACNCSDITQRVRMQDQLRKLSQSVEQSPNIEFITNTDGAIEYVNSKFGEMTGYSSEEAIGAYPTFLGSGARPGPAHAEMMAAIQSGEAWRGEVKNSRKDGTTFWSDASVAPILGRDGAITHFFFSYTDITRRKLVEDELRFARDQAIVANLAKTDMIANMNHELRTPLNAIIGFSNIMKNGVFGPVENDRYKEYVEDICDSGEHLMEVLNDILDVSAIESGEIELKEENLDITSIVEASIRFVQIRAEQEKVTISPEIVPDLPALFADSRRVKQVLINLLFNSIKFTPAGGRITVVAYLRNCGSLVISVADTGIGMDDDEVGVALSRFGQVDSGLDRKIQEGTGLGLPLCLGFMELHGGELEIKSKKMQGTEVILTFPSERTVLNKVLLSEIG